MLEWKQIDGTDRYEAWQDNTRFVIRSEITYSYRIPTLERIVYYLKIYRNNGYTSEQRYMTVGVCKAQATRIAKRLARLKASEQQTITKEDL